YFWLSPTPPSCTLRDAEAAASGTTIRVFALCEDTQQLAIYDPQTATWSYTAPPGVSLKTSAAVVPIGPIGVINAVVIDASGDLWEYSTTDVWDRIGNPGVPLQRRIDPGPSAFLTSDYSMIGAIFLGEDANVWVAHSAGGGTWAWDRMPDPAPSC